MTEDMMNAIADKQASYFLDGSAQCFINLKIENSYIEQLHALYQRAGNTSYRLWTRRTAMKCSGLHELGNPIFNVDDERLAPHTLVRYEKHEDQLKSRPITVVVHPVLEVCGTDEAEDYDKTRVWARAEVWLDSR